MTIELNWFFWLVIWIVAAKLYANYRAHCQCLDNPEPVLYPLHTAGVWAQVDRVLRTAKATWKNVHVSIDYSNPEPPPGQPILVLATITVHH